MQLKAQELQDMLAEEMDNHWVGPMPVTEFLEAFLPFKSEELTEKPVLPATYFDKLEKAISEKKMHNPFVC